MCFHDIMNHHDIFEAFWHTLCWGVALELEAPPIYYNKAGAVSISGHIMSQDEKTLGLKWFVWCFLFLGVACWRSWFLLGWLCFRALWGRLWSLWIWELLCAVYCHSLVDGAGNWRAEECACHIFANIKIHSWLMLWNICFDFPYIGNNHPNWRTHIFQRGRYTTNQIQ